MLQQHRRGALLPWESWRVDDRWCLLAGLVAVGSHCEWGLSGILVVSGAEVQVSHADAAVGLQAFFLLLGLGVVVVSACLAFEEVALGNGLVVHVSLLGLRSLAALGDLFLLAHQLGLVYFLAFLAKELLMLQVQVFVEDVP